MTDVSERLPRAEVRHTHEATTRITPPDSMANKYCNHYTTHNCTNQVAYNQSLCDDCAAGKC